MIALEELLAVGGTLALRGTAATFGEICYDSRLAQPGDLFVALRSPRRDGHEFIADALLAGVHGVLCREPPHDPQFATIVTCPDPLELLVAWASARLHHVHPRTLAVAGGIGKTSARRALAAILAAAGHAVFQSRRSFNTPLGLAVSLARLSAPAELALLEFGAERPGELALLCAAFPPAAALITGSAWAQRRGFATRSAEAAELAALADCLPLGAPLVLNGDDPFAAQIAATHPHVCYGRAADADLRLLSAHFARNGTTLSVTWRTAQATWTTPLIGWPGVWASLAAASMALTLGCSLADCAAGLAAVEPAAGRLRPLVGPGGALLLDDSFDATLPAATAALASLAALPARRRIALIGDLDGLPSGESAAYAELHGALAACDRLITLGDGVASLAANHPNAHALHTHSEARHALPNDLGADDLLLICGGAAMRFERLIRQLLPPNSDPHLLARQEQAWRSVRIGDPGRPTRLRIDLDALANNTRLLAAHTGVPVMAVLKADGYGHGAIRAARSALAAGARWLAVATIGEGRSLRHAGISAPILVLGYTPPWQMAEALSLDLTVTIFDDDAAAALDTAGQQQQRRAKAHLKVDTGMARLGVFPEDAAALVARLRHLPALKLEGVYSHFATADEADLQASRAQLARFARVIAQLEANGLRPPLVHMANSAAALRLPAARFDLTRPGIALFGLAPGPDCPLPAGFAPVLSFHSEIAQVKDLPAGRPISYGATYVTSRASRIATIPVGYADGLRRTPPWREVLVRGQRAPIVGRICMDYAMIDVTAIGGVRRGDAVTLIGSQGAAAISAAEVAAWLGTISYEVVAGILPRVPREVA